MRTHAIRTEAPREASAPTLWDRWLALRNRVLSNPRFQRWAARFPLTRGIARRRASALFDMCAGFVYSQVLQACVRLGLFEALAAGPRSAEELARDLGLTPQATLRLLLAAASLELVERSSGGRYCLGMHGAAFLGNPSIAAMVEHHALLYRDLEDPVALLRGAQRPTALQAFWSYTHEHAPNERDVAGYSVLMARSLSLIAEDVLEAYPYRRHRHLLDVGGGEGAFLEAAAARAPHLSLTLFDLPAVAMRARDRFASAGLGDRATAVGGDVFRDALPEGADLVSLVRVVHDHDDPRAMQILHAVRRAIGSDGTLLLAEPMAETEGALAMGDAYFGFYLLAMGQGQPRTEARLREMLRDAGFGRVTPCATRRPFLSRLLVASAG